MADFPRIEIQSWEELASELTRMQDEAAWSARGEPRSYPNVLSCIDRFAQEGWTSSKHSRLMMEWTLSQRFLQHAGELVTDVGREYLYSVDFLGRAMLARHFGVPTRLVDWSESLWIAAYFAVNIWGGRSEDESEGRILLFDRHHLKNSLDEEVKRVTVPSVLAEYNDRRGKGEPALKITDLYRFTTLEGIPLLLHAPTVEAMGEAANLVIPWYREGTKFPRLAAQRGSFTFSNEPWRDHWDSISELLGMYTGLKGGKGCKEIVIPGNKKAQILHGLDFMGIHAASLYPGLQGVGQYMCEFAQSADFDKAFCDLYVTPRDH